MEAKLLKLDHLMVEVAQPEATANNIAQQLGLPFAWPLLESENYSSIGINFGDINIEFIRFNKRFGYSNTNFHGFSGIAFEIAETIDTCQQYLTTKNLTSRIGEQAAAHTTITVEEDSVFPTIFLVKYHFDTTGWKKRLQQEFQHTRGGCHNISHLTSIELAQSDATGLLSEMNIIPADKNRLVFSSCSLKKNQRIDLIPDLEIWVA